jgi:dTDP-4-amino-4,6-dideoxygalactose transaminase
MINVFGSYTGQEEIDEVSSSLKAQWLGMGAKVEKFERLMMEKTGLDFVAVDNCSNALYMACEILNLTKGSEVIVPSVTWISCANAVIQAGLKPVFADCDYDTVNITDETIDKVRTRKTRAVMVVHYAGLPADVCPDRLPIIADCAHAVDSYMTLGGNGKKYHIANFADISVFSFDSIKNIAAGELGGIAALNTNYTEKAKHMRYCGILKSGFQASGDKKRWWEYEIAAPFIKMLPNDICASIAIAQYKKLDEMQGIRKRIHEAYDLEFSGINGVWLLTPPPIPKHLQHGYFTYYLRILNGKRDELAYFLKEKGIYTTVRYQPLHLIKNYNSRQKLPVAELLNEQLINIPMHPGLSDDDVCKVIEAVRYFGEKN